MIFRRLLFHPIDEAWYVLFPIFNVADIYVTLSCIALAVMLIFNEKFIPEIPFSSKKDEEKEESGNLFPKEDNEADLRSREDK